MLIRGFKENDYVKNCIIAAEVIENTYGFEVLINKQVDGVLTTVKKGVLFKEAFTPACEMYYPSLTIVQLAVELNKEVCKHDDTADC